MTFYELFQIQGHHIQSCDWNYPSAYTSKKLVLVIKTIFPLPQPIGGESEFQYRFEFRSWRQAAWAAKTGTLSNFSQPLL
jgi:hypothetical protein